MGSYDDVIAWINCRGEGEDNVTSDEYVTLSRGVDAFEHTALAIDGENEDYFEMGTSYRYSRNDFTYTIEVPYPGLYDVTLVFAEIHFEHFGVGKRVFDAVVEGKEQHEFCDIDVYKEVKKDTVYTLTAEKVRAEEKIFIHLKKGKSSLPFISGFVVRDSNLNWSKKCNVAVTDTVKVSKQLKAYAPAEIKVEGDKLEHIVMARAQRYSDSDFTFTCWLAPGMYDVVLVFSEIDPAYQGTGKRVFDVSVRGTNNSYHHNNLDVFSKVGADKVYTIRAWNIIVEPGGRAVCIDLKKGKSHFPMIAGFQVFKSSSICPRSPSRPLVDSSIIRTFFRDLNKPHIKVDGWNQEYAEWCSSYRWNNGNAHYMVNVPAPGEYDVTLVFAEIYPPTTPGKRVFDIDVRGSQGVHTFSNVDVVKKAGLNKLYTRTAENVHAESLIYIDLKDTGSGYPILSGFEVTRRQN